MTVTAASFRVAFPEFTSITKYPDGQVDFWLALAVELLNAARWGTVLDYGVQLFVAHNLVLGYMAERQGANGVPGAASGMLNSKSVDKVSAGYDTASVAETDAGHWNLTTYGQRYVRMMRMFGAGPIQIGAGCGIGVGAWGGINLDNWGGGYP